MNKELQLFIIWKNAIDRKDEIISDIKKSFKLRNIYKVIWSEENWSNNLSRFYGTHLPDGCGKEEHCGKDYFLLLIVEDVNPKYDYRKTSRGLEKVNVNMFDKKELYREWTGGGHRIHATNSLEETNHDLTLLLGKNVEDYIKTVRPSKKLVEYQNDIVGAIKWNSLEEIFYVLNNCTKYVILRDYENDMCEMYDNPNYDADVLCQNKIDMKWLLNATEVFLDNHIQYEINLKGNKALFDLKYLGDDYYCYDLEKDILNSRLLHNGYYIPDNEYDYLANLFHAIVHKDNYETEYNDRLAAIYPKKHDKKKTKEYYINLLSNWMIEKGYYITVQKENPYKMNLDNIKKFDKKLYRYDIDTEIELKREIKKVMDENYKYKEIIRNKDEKINELKRNYQAVISSKGWKMLEVIRKLKLNRK